MVIHVWEINDRPDYPPEIIQWPIGLGIVVIPVTADTYIYGEVQSQVAWSRGHSLDIPFPSAIAAVLNQGHCWAVWKLKVLVWVYLFLFADRI